LILRLCMYNNKFSLFMYGGIHILYVYFEYVVYCIVLII